MKTKPIPQYDGSACTSDCRREGCYHEFNFDQRNGIVRNHLDFDVKHQETTHYEVVWADGKPMTKVDDNILLK